MMTQAPEALENPAPFSNFDRLPQGAFCVRMTQGMCVTKHFEMIYNARAPLPFEELQGIMDELNAVVMQRFPPCLRILPCLATVVGFLTFAGGVLSMSSGGFDGPPQYSLNLCGLGFVLFVVGPFSMCCLSRCAYGALDALKRKLGELNDRYRERGIDFDLHVSSHLEMYTTHQHGGYSGSDVDVRRVNDYTLVIQSLQQLGGNRIPASNTLSSQALQGFAPSAPQPPMGPGVAPMQQPLVMAQPMQQQPVKLSTAMPGMMTVTCPPGAGPGSPIQVQAPNGQMCTVQVPAGVVPGGQFQVQL